MGRLGTLGGVLAIAIIITREDVSTSMGRASANPTQVLWHNKSGIFNRLVPYSDNISQLSVVLYKVALSPISPFDLPSFCPVWHHARPETLSPISSFG